MFIKLVVRKNKIIQEDLSLLSSDFILFDNCSEVKYGSRKLCDISEFMNLHTSTEGARNNVNSIYNMRNHPNRPKHIHSTLKNYEVCDADEKYHYNIIEWKNTKTNEWHRLVFDTFIFIMDDHGKTMEKIEG